MLHILLAAAANTAGGGGGGSPFALTGCSHAQTSYGTSCANQMMFSVSITYTGDPTGVTLKLEQNVDGTGYQVLQTGLSPTSFPRTNIVGAMYWGKFAPLKSMQFRVTNEADALDTASSSLTSTTAVLCGV